MSIQGLVLMLSQLRHGHGYVYKWMDPGKTTSGYHPEAICWMEYPPSKIWTDLEDYNVIFAYFGVRCGLILAKLVQFYHHPH
jgi:hypothetical protein